MFNEAMNAAGEYIGNAIQEILVVKKQAEHPRVLPSLQHMKIVSNFEFDGGRHRSSWIVAIWF